MTNRMTELDEIHSIVIENSNEVPSETRKRFWKIVRQIKRNPKPDEQEVLRASEIRNILFDANRGRTFPLGPVLALETVLGLLLLWGYIWTLGTPLDWTGILAWSFSNWLNFGLRLLIVFLIVACIYPLGRVIAGKWAGIKLEGICRDEYYQPTVRIDYVTFLKAPASKRKWFFFFSGFWTVITLLWVWIVGMFLAGDFTRPDRSTMTIGTEEGTYRLAVGLDGLYRMTPTDRFGRMPRDNRIAVRGRWTGDQSFAMDYMDLGDPNHARLNVNFSEDRISISADFELIGLHLMLSGIRAP